jgi:hypothetical protein
MVIWRGRAGKRRWSRYRPIERGQCAVVRLVRIDTLLLEAFEIGR